MTGMTGIIPVVGLSLTRKSYASQRSNKMATVNTEGALALLTEVMKNQNLSWLRSPCGVFWLKLSNHNVEDIVRARMRRESMTVVGSPFLPSCRTCGNRSTIRLSEGENYG